MHFQRQHKNTNKPYADISLKVNKIKGYYYVE